MVKVGVIGVGSMGQNHARIYKEIAELVGVYDQDQVQSKKVAKRFDVEVFDSIDSMLRLVDAVSVCTTTSTHLDVAKRVIDEGKGVLVEKPFTGESKKAEELRRRAEKEGVTLAAGFVERHNPIVGAARGAIKEGKFGRVISFASRRVSSFPSRVRDVGVIMDLGIHDVDVLRYITSDEVRSVYVLGGKSVNSGFEDHASLLIAMRNGLVASLEVNWLTPMKVRKVSLTCTGGFVQLDYIDQSLEISSSSTGDFDPADMFRIHLEHETRRISVRKEEPLRLELEDFLKAATTGGEPLATANDAVAALRVCEAAQESLLTGNRIDIGQG